MKYDEIRKKGIKKYKNHPCPRDVILERKKEKITFTIKEPKPKPKPEPEQEVEPEEKIKDDDYMGKSGNIKWQRLKPVNVIMEPKITYVYYCYNVISQRGESTIRSSFDSIKGQSDDIIVIDHDSEDNIKEIVEEYGFRYFNVPKTENIYCHHSKMMNKSIIEAKYDLFTQLEADIIYPNNLSMYITSFYQKHNPKKISLFIRCFYDIDGALYPTKTYQRYSGALRMFWKPYLIEGRGIDERCTFGNSSKYQLCLMRDVFNCTQKEAKNYFLIHRDHPPQQGKQTEYEKQMFKKMNFKNRLFLLSKDLKKHRKNVVNSYW